MTATTHVCKQVCACSRPPLSLHPLHCRWMCRRHCVPRMLLHAAELELAHAATAGLMNVTALLPGDLPHAPGVRGLPGGAAQPEAECAGA